MKIDISIDNSASSKATFIYLMDGEKNAIIELFEFEKSVLVYVYDNEKNFLQEKFENVNLAKAYAFETIMNLQLLTEDNEK